MGTTAYAESQPWPLKGDVDLSSGYGDYRAGGRFHVGLDLRTGGQVGAKVYSPVDGYIWRVRMSYGGYGKGLYLKGHSGHIYVFGHLSGFNETIQAVVSDRQFRQKRYFVDLEFPADSIPVKAGQLIAYSGQTGAGGPHLHVEKRTGDNVPLNPLTHGFVLDDQIPPTFAKVGLHLLDDRSLFADGHRKTYLPVRRVGPGQYEVTRPIMINAPFGILVECFDHMRPGGRRQAVYRLSLTIDDSLYYESILDSLSYDFGPIVDLIYEPTQIANGDLRLRRTYRPVPEDQVWSGARTSYGGKVSGRCAYGLNTTPVVGEHRAVMLAEDAFGNQSELVLRFDYVEPGSSRSMARQCEYAAEDVLLNAELSGWWLEEDGLVTRVGTGRSSRFYFFRPRPPAEAFLGDVGEVFRRHSAQFVEKGIDLQAAGWGRGRHISMDSGAFSLVLPPGTFFAPQFIAVSAVEARGGAGADVVSNAYQVLPETAAMRERLQVSISLASGVTRSRAGLCRRDGDGGAWTWIGNNSGDSSVIAGSSAGGGVFAALADTEAPTISGLNLSHKHKYYDRKPAVKFRLKDNLSGFEDDRSIDVRIDGRWLLPEFDAEEGAVVATLRESLDLGPHLLEITAVDRAGNRTEKKIEFEIVKRSKK